MSTGDLYRQLQEAKAAGTLVEEPFDMGAYVNELAQEIGSTSQQEADNSQRARNQGAGS